MLTTYQFGQAGQEAINQKLVSLLGTLGSFGIHSNLHNLRILKRIGGYTGLQVIFITGIFAIVIGFFSGLNHGHHNTTAFQNFCVGAHELLSGHSITHRHRLQYGATNTLRLFHAQQRYGFICRRHNNQVDNCSSYEATGYLFDGAYIFL